MRGQAPDEVLVEYQGGTPITNKRWLIADERGSIVGGANSSGATLFKNVYDEYGRPGSANQGRFQYTGQMWLAEAGLYHYKARIYDPGLGRFLQTDPIGYADGLNLYAYVGGDPVNATDPTGTEIRDEIIVTGIRRDYNIFLEGTLRDIAFGGSFGLQNEIADGARDFANDTKDAVDRSLCGSTGQYASDFSAAAARILPNGTAAQIASLSSTLSNAYSEASRALRYFNEPSRPYTAYSAEDIGVYVYRQRRNGAFRVGGPNVAAPSGTCFDCQAGLVPERGVLVSVVAPYIGNLASTYDNYADRIYRREPIYNGASRRLGAPVAVGTPFGVCVFGGGS